MKRLLLLLIATLGACDRAPEGKPLIRQEIGYNALKSKSGPDAGQSQTALFAENSACKVVSFEDAALIDCIADPAKHRISTALMSDQNAPYRSLEKLATAYNLSGKSVSFAVNGGMFAGDGRPLGYYVENKKRLKELNQGSGSENFYMKPNGVFYGTGQKWQIKTSDNFFRQVGDRPDFGTQSGPMLVIDGALHPDFAQDGASQAIRNGVGIDGAGRAHFVKSQGVISFGKFARFFRDQLKVKNALYLDSQVSSLWDPVSNHLDKGMAIGPIVVVENIN